MLHATPDGGVAVSILGPVSAVFPGGWAVNVTTEYPFADDVTITLSGLPQGSLTTPLMLRIPSWATNATLSINGAPPAPVGGSNGTMLRVRWPPGATGPTATVVLATAPTVRAAPWYNGALAVSRGALLYALRLDETFQATGHAAGEPRAVDYVVSAPGCDISPSTPNCTALWNVAIVLDDPAAPVAGFTFSRTGPTPATPFAAGPWGASNLELTGLVRSVGAWGLANNAAAPPPASPVDCSAPASCGEPFLATFVPFGATHLRVAELPWTTRPPCGRTLGYNASGRSALALGSADFDLRGGASIEPDGGSDTLRSGDPGDVSTAAALVTLQDAAHPVTGVAFSFQYVAGYGADGAPGGCVVELVAFAPGPCGVGGAVLASLWKSEPLIHYPFDVCATCFSPPVPVSVPAGSISLNATMGVVLGLRFTDNERNVQVKLPLSLTVFWGQ